MDANDMFTMAVRLVAANIQAGQYNDLRSLPTIVEDQVVEVFAALESAYERCTAAPDATH